MDEKTKRAKRIATNFAKKMQAEGKSVLIAVSDVGVGMVGNMKDVATTFIDSMESGENADALFNFIMGLAVPMYCASDTFRCNFEYHVNQTLKKIKENEREEN